MYKAPRTAARPPKVVRGPWRVPLSRLSTLVKVFGRHRYRTIAIMPGLLLDWPQGAFDGFEDIYALSRLNYQGPPKFVFFRVDKLALSLMPNRA